MTFSRASVSPSGSGRDVMVKAHRYTVADFGGADVGNVKEVSGDVHKANRGEVVNELGEHLAITKESELGVVLEVTGVDAEEAGRARRRIDDERSTVIGEAELPPGRRQWLARDTLPAPKTFNRLVVQSPKV